MKILILGNGVMSTILKDIIDKSNDDIAVAMLDTKNDIECNLDFDVIIDFSNHLATKKVVDFAISKNKPILIATTGQDEIEQKYIIDNMNRVKILQISNTSLGVYALNEAIKLVSNILSEFDIAIEEIHHTRKVDAPSGTAKTMLKSVKQVLGNDKEVEVNSFRLSNIAGIHKIMFAGTDEILEIKHTAISRKIFAMGAIKYARDLIK